MTPIRRQYLKIKHAYPDAIVLFRLGDFYETFDQDAQTASRELEITLTSRSMGKDLRVPMAGVPAHSLDPYLARLIKKGYQVAICEQLSDAAVSKGLVERDVVRVVTPGTVLESQLLDQGANNYLASVVEEGDSAGLAYVDITTGQFAATQLDPSQVLPELERIAPAEILFPRSQDHPAWTAGRDTESPLARRLTGVDPSSFDLSDASQALRDHYGVLTLESFGCQGLPLAVRAAGAIVNFLAATQKTGKPKLAALAVYSTADHMALDSQTRRNLELFEGGRSGDKQFSLLACLDLTKTPMGGRLLRQWLGRPLLDLDQLNQRLDAMDYFFQDGFRRAAVVQLLSQIADLERIMGRVNGGTAAPRDLKALQKGLELVPSLADQLAIPTEDSDSSSGPPVNGTTGPMAWLSRRLSVLPDVTALLDQALAPDPSGAVGEGNVIREGFSTELDELKRTSRDARGVIAGLEQRERDRTGIRGLKVGYNQVFGYYIEVSNANKSQVPPDYVRRQTLVNAERYIVPELKDYESQVLNAREQIEQLERSLYRRVCDQVSGAAAAIADRAAAVARVDVFSALAEVAVRGNFVRPALDSGGAISIEGGRHPVVESVLDPGSYVPNDVDLANDGPQVLVITGPNMAGKSTFIRQVAIIVLMAQIGSFVPASKATIGLVDCIFTRVGLQDDLATGQSTFMVEMVETAAILNRATPRSLVVLDEIGRGTSTYDGLSIARAVVEHLHNDPRLGCKTLFATHYHELTELAASLPGVRNFSVAVTEQDGDVVFLHRIVPGGADKSYGVHVAQLAGLPQGVVNRAWEVLAGLEQNPGPGQGPENRRRAPAAQQMPLFNPAQPLVDELKSLDIPNLTPLQAINLLYQLQEKAGGGGD